MLPTTIERVLHSTPASINERIQRQTEENVARCLSEGPEAIHRRLEELDAEWDIERYLETMAPVFTLFGIAMGLGRSRKWFALPIMIQSFFLQHALQGWCPPLPVLRSLGVRTQSEIDQERYALKLMRADFQHLDQSGSAKASAVPHVMQAVRK